jgi:hypothetical protein
MMDEYTKMMLEVEKQNKKVFDENPELKKQLSESMKNSSPLPDYIPSKLFHAASPANRKSIAQNGIEANPMFGMVNTCETAEQCKRFVQGDIWEIDTEYLNPGEFRLSLDHNKQVYPFDVWAYYGHVPKQAIKRRDM